MAGATTTVAATLSAFALAIGGPMGCTIQVPDQTIQVVKSNDQTSTPSPTPTPTPTPSPTPSASDLIRARLKAAAFGTPTPSLLGDGSTVENVLDDPASSPITNRMLHPFNTGEYRFVGQTTLQYGYDTCTTEHFLKTVDDNTCNVDFDTNAPVFEIAYVTNNGNLRVLVDGKRISDDLIDFTGPFNTRKVARVRLATSGTHHIRIEYYNWLFRGIYIGAADTMSAPVISPSNPPIRAVIVGDSITHAGTSGSPLYGYAPITARTLGWGDYIQSGVGGTGYGAFESGVSVKFQDRFATDVYPYKPEVIVFAGGINDQASTIQADATAAFDDVQKNLPDTIVFVLGPWCPHPSSSCDGRANSLIAAIGSRKNFYFINNVSEYWQTGSGDVGNSQGDGNSDLYVSADHIHPNQAGQAYLASRLIADLKSIMSGW